MVFFSIGLPSLFADWCDALLLRLVEHYLGPAQSVPINGIEELATAAIRSTAAHLVISCRQPVPRLQTEILQGGRPFLLALGNPLGALRDTIERAGLDLPSATRAVASGCAAMLPITQGAHALALTPQIARDAAATASAIARHFQIEIADAEVAPLVAQLPDAGLEFEEIESRTWREALSERDRAIVEGALGPYMAHFAGDRLERLVWQPELFYVSEGPVGSTPLPLVRPVDLTGRPRIVVFGPYISLPPGAWIAEVVLGFSTEAVGMNCLVEIFAGDQLAHSRITAAREQVIETQLPFTIDNSLDQPVQVRIWTERSALDGRLALGYVAVTRQATIPDETRARLVNVLQ